MGPIQKMLNPRVNNREAIRWHCLFLGQDSYSQVKNKDSEVTFKKSKLNATRKEDMEAVAEGFLTEEP